MSGSDRGNFVLNVAEERGVREAVGRASEELGRVEGPLVLMVAEDERPAGVRGGEHDDERAKHVAVCRCICVRLEERAFA